MGNIFEQKSSEEKAQFILNIDNNLEPVEKNDFLQKFSCTCLPQKQYDNKNSSNINSIILPNGNRYIGETIDDIPNGRGTEISPLGDSFDGYYIMGRKWGLGQQIQHNKFIYIGCFKNDLFDGNGIIMSEDYSYTNYQWKEGKEIKN